MQTIHFLTFSDADIDTVLDNTKTARSPLARSVRAGLKAVKGDDAMRRADKPEQYQIPVTNEELQFAIDVVIQVGADRIAADFAARREALGISFPSSEAEDVIAALGLDLPARESSLRSFK
jgi:hypothetical protein